MKWVIYGWSVVPFYDWVGYGLLSSASSASRSMIVRSAESALMSTVVVCIFGIVYCMSRSAIMSRSFGVRD